VEGEAGDVTSTHGDLIGSSAYVPDTSDEAFAFDRTVSRLVRNAHTFSLSLSLTHTYTHTHAHAHTI
jgi:hypothetical protein